MPLIKVNGKELETPPGDKLLKVLIDNGTFVPHYCWHPGLVPHGNCRMCLVKVSNSRKLEVACMYPCTDKLEVTTEGPDIDAARKAVMEYLLINHPLDCPICDKAGECSLQDYTYTYRKGTTRFDETKNVRHTKDLGPQIKIWGTRCIACTRCVRFCDDIVGTGELSLVNRGDHAVIDVHPEVPIDNPMSLNVVDICPVGALIDKNFLYQARVWFAKSPDTICPSCSHGCNVKATVLKNDIKRLQPRHNPDVNDYWMCDAGRLNTKFVSSPDRLLRSKGTAKELAVAARAFVAANGPGSLGIVASTWLTTEELFVLQKLATALGAKVAFLRNERGERWVSKSGFAIERDKSPNTRGAEHLFGPLADLASLIGSVKGLIVVNSIPDYTIPAELVAAAARVEFLAVADLLANPLAEGAKFVIASSTWAEKDGTFVNRDGRIQRIRPLLAVQGGSRPELVWMQEALVELGLQRHVLSAEGVLKQAIPGADFARVGSRGLGLDELAAPVAAPTSTDVHGEAK
jgi:NADH-quinone oxidoreductase subunit G